MSSERLQLATLAAARTLRSSYCMLAYGRALLGDGFDAARVRDVVRDHRSAGLPEIDVAVMDLAVKIAHDATTVEQADIDRLRERGLSDDEILDVVLTAAYRCFFSKTLDALGVRADRSFAELDPDLRDALTVGRPIATA